MCLRVKKSTDFSDTNLTPYSTSKPVCGGEKSRKTSVLLDFAKSFAAHRNALFTIFTTTQTTTEAIQSITPRIPRNSLKLKGIIIDIQIRSRWRQ
jgi:uncharacterized membrane protein